MNAMYSFIYILLWPFFNLVHPSKVMGREHIPRSGALICANHTALSDPLFAVFAFGRKNRLRFMAKSELMRVPVIGWLLSKAGIFGVERGKSDVAAIKEALRTLKNGERLMLFPEGTRYKEGEGGQAKTGAAMLALRSGVPVIPVYIPGKKVWFGRTKIVIGKPYLPNMAGKRPTAEDYRDVADDLMARIYALKEQGYE